MDSKFSRIDELKSSGKAACITADSFVQHNAAVSVKVEAHEETISQLVSSYRTLENQVKAIARVMATQNIQQLSEHLKRSQDDSHRSMMNYVNEKQRDVMNMVERELTDVTDAKSGLGKKIDGVEANLLAMFSSKMEEAGAMRHANREEIEKIKEMIENVPDPATNARAIKVLEVKVTELKNDFRKMEQEGEKANVEQDKEVAALTNEIRSKLEAARDKINEETKSLSKSIRKHEANMEDRLKGLTELIERETIDRVESQKSFPVMIKENVLDLRNDVERKISSVEASIELKVRPFLSSVQEVKRLIDQETVQRETGDNELARIVSKEIKDRHHDEEHLIGLISTCQTTLAKMHRVN